MIAAALLVVGTVVQAQNYEIWVVDRGNATIHVYNDRLEEAARVDMTPHGVRAPHMIDFARTANTR